jgi:dihydrodipicolinate reductase
VLFINSFSFAGNAELYSKVGVPFVIGTTGGDRDLLYKTVEDSKNYAVISPQMGKQVNHNSENLEKFSICHVSRLLAVLYFVILTPLYFFL